jgi:hypothetical protein
LLHLGKASLSGRAPYLFDKPLHDFDTILAGKVILKPIDQVSHGINSFSRVTHVPSGHVVDRWIEGNPADSSVMLPSNPGFRNKDRKARHLLGQASYEGSSDNSGITAVRLVSGD